MKDKIKCKICGNEKNNKIFSVREMMFGFRDKFQYLECDNCKCLQLINIPKDFSKYYPEDYYSIKKEDKNNFLSFLKEKLKEKRDLYGIGRKGTLGKIFFKIRPRYDYFSIFKYIQKNKKILDVGCGNGHLLKRLNKLEYLNLTGVDPFIEKTELLNKKIRLIKGDIFNIEEKFDVIMFHHSFEHISNPLEVLKQTEKLLNEKGICIIRIPTVPNLAWEKYKENWFQLDAPRHIFIHSKKSLEILAKKAKLKIDKVVFDSTFNQFLASELYKKDIPLIKQNYKKYFTKKEIKKAKSLAKKMNEERKGDQAIFYLSHK